MGLHVYGSMVASAGIASLFFFSSQQLWKRVDKLPHIWNHNFKTVISFFRKSTYFCTSLRCPQPFLVYWLKVSNVYTQRNQECAPESTWIALVIGRSGFVGHQVFPLGVSRAVGSYDLGVGKSGLAIVVSLVIASCIARASWSCVSPTSGKKKRKWQLKLSNRSSSMLCVRACYHLVTYPMCALDFSEESA